MDVANSDLGTDPFLPERFCLGFCCCETSWLCLTGVELGCETVLKWRGDEHDRNINKDYGSVSCVYRFYITFHYSVSRRRAKIYNLISLYIGVFHHDGVSAQRGMFWLPIP
jgi:hypothetical protein